MDAKDQTQSTAANQDRDMVCPACFRPLPGCIPIQQAPGIRSYRSTCNNCGKEWEVVQFLKQESGRWALHKWRRWAEGESGVKGAGKWNVVQPLLQPDCCEQVAPAASIESVSPLSTCQGNCKGQIDPVDLLKRVSGILRSAGQAVEAMQKLLEENKNDGR